MSEAASPTPEAVEKLAGRFAMKLERIRALLGAAATLTAEGASSQPSVGDDVRRAAVVLLHAALEDLLREGQRAVLTSTLSRALLDEIGFPLRDSGRLRPKFQEKLSLGDLCERFPVELPVSIAKLAVNEWLDHKSYSHVGEVAGALASLELDSKTLIGPAGRPLSAMMLRRHQIAHRGDHLPQTSKEDRLEPLDEQEFEEWIGATTSFADRFVAHLAARWADLFAAQVETARLIDSMSVSAEQVAKQVP